MLAPIVTKDMKLFPSRPLPPGIKNVRSRAQSLDQVTQQQASTSMRGRIVPIKPRNSQSVGNLPIAGQKSPPKISSARKSTLTAIVEGVEMGTKANTSSASRIAQRPRGTAATVSGDPRCTSSAADDLAGHQKENQGSPDLGKNQMDEAKDNKEKNRVLRWITNALRSKSKSESSDECLSTNSS